MSVSLIGERVNQCCSSPTPTDTDSLPVAGHLGTASCTAANVSLHEWITLGGFSSFFHLRMHCPKLSL